MSETETTTETSATEDENLDAFSDDFFGQKSKDEGKTKPEPNEAAQDDGKVEADAQVEETPDPNEDPEAEFKEAPPKKKTVQDRIDELVRQREEVKRDADAKLDALRQEFEAFKNGAKKVDPPASQTAEPTPDALKDNGEPKYPLGDFDPDYIRDLTRYTLAVEREKADLVSEQQRRQTEVNQAQVTLQTEWNTKLEVAKTEYPDLEEKGRDLLNGFNNLPIDYASYLSTVLMSMDKGPDVLYYLSNHPDEARQIVNSGAQKATLALGRIEAKFLDADAEKQLAKPKITKAPPPPTERARGTNGAFISVAPDTDDLDDFETEFFRKK